MPAQQRSFEVEPIFLLGKPKPQHLREHDRFQPAWWTGDKMTRTAAPVWVPYTWQHELLLESDVQGETTANRRYKPLTV